MNRTLLGLRGGVRIINWPAVLALGLLAAVVSGCAAAGTCFLLTGQFSVPATAGPMSLCVALYLGAGFRRVLLVPTRQLPLLD